MELQRDKMLKTLNLKRWIKKTSTSTVEYTTASVKKNGTRWMCSTYLIVVNGEKKDEEGNRQKKREIERSLTKPN